MSAIVAKAKGTADNGATSGGDSNAKIMLSHLDPKKSQKSQVRLEEIKQKRGNNYFKLALNKVNEYIAQIDNRPVKIDHLTAHDFKILREHVMTQQDNHNTSQESIEIDDTPQDRLRFQLLVFVKNADSYKVKKHNERIWSIISKEL